MNKIIPFTLMILMLAVLSGQGAESGGNTSRQDTKSSQVLGDLASALTEGKIEQVEIFFVPESVTTRAAIVPSWLEKNFYSKLTLGHASSNTQLRKLGQILNLASARVAKGISEVRWGCKFYLANGALAHSIYLHHKSEFAIVDDQPVMLQAGLLEWLNTKVLTGFTTLYGE